MEDERGDGGRPGGGDRADRVAQLIRAVAEEGDDRRHQDPAADPAVRQGADHVQPAFGGGGAGLDRAPQLLVGEPDGDGDAYLRDLGGLPQQVEIAQDQRALGQDRERVRVVAQGPDDAGHQPVAAFGPLVAVDVRAHRDVLAVPGAGGQMAAQQFGGVDLDDDLGVEAEPRVQVQIAVRPAGEAVHAGVRAAPVRVHGPFERHAGGPGHPVHDRAGPDLVEGDPPEFGGVEGARRHRVRGEERTTAFFCGVLRKIVPAHERLLGSTPQRIEHMFP